MAFPKSPKWLSGQDDEPVVKSDRFDLDKSDHYRFQAVRTLAVHRSIHFQ